MIVMDNLKQQTVAHYKGSNDTLESFVIYMFLKGRNHDGDC